ncbi:MAG: CDP-alcohol phosphatidyltransferase family protein [Actinomycetota bacterium]|nr:CDP-alcohol phosphatidyltransferase family protein [Actinomycetota bacterium]
MAGLTAQLALLAVLGAAVGLGGLGWVVGLGCAVVVNWAMALGRTRSGGHTLSPADLVTLTRATLACGVAALTADAFRQPPPVALFVALAALALALDAVDGWVARRTRTASAFGARFDGEVDAFLILVLSVYVARSVGGWVLAIGAARYVFALAGWGTPWQLPTRPWRKVVAGTQGVVLTFAAAEVLPRWLTYAALIVALSMLLESFGRDTWWLWRLRRAGLIEDERPQADTAGRRRVVAAATDVLALLMVWLVLVAPNQLSRLTVDEFLRIPVEGLVVAGLALALPSAARRAVAVVAGGLLSMLALVKVLDVAFFAAFDRPFDLATDRGYLGPAIELVRDALGPVTGTLILVGGGGLVLAVAVGLPLAVGRLTRLVTRHRTRSLRIVTGLAVIWAVLAVTGLHIGAGTPIASTSASRAAAAHVGALVAGAQDEQRFEAAIAADRFDDQAGEDMLTGLRGKDVLLVFVESYGRSAIEGLPSSSRVRAVLDAGTRRLRASGHSARSAFLTSPTFGGFSWLAHATLQSGLWVDNEQRHERLLAGDRMTLTRAFDSAGWQTFAVMPSNKERWPQGMTFYRFDEMFDREDIGYRGPRFGWSFLPDQYTLSAFQRRVLAAPDRAPVMAEIDLSSSHPPWAPLPRMLGWDSLGDGSVFQRIHNRSRSAEELWRDPDRVEAAYARSIGYSLSTVVSFVERYGDDDLVLVVVGDHQPAAVVTGPGASRDVPVTLIAGDPAVIDRVSGWGWQPGLRPDARAPVWPMDAFRDRFLAAYSGQGPLVRASSALQRSRQHLDR